jgi:hypothetical protein
MTPLDLESRKARNGIRPKITPRHADVWMMRMGGATFAEIASKIMVSSSYAQCLFRIADNRISSSFIAAFERQQHWRSVRA